MKPLSITAGILFVILAYAEFDLDHEPMQVLKECKAEKKEGCHISKYELMEMRNASIIK